MLPISKSLLPTRRRLRLDPPNKLFFPYEAGKQVKSAIGIKNTCKSHVAFKKLLLHSQLLKVPFPAPYAESPSPNASDDDKKVKSKVWKIVEPFSPSYDKFLAPPLTRENNFGGDLCWCAEKFS